MAETNIPNRISLISGRSVLVGFLVALLGNFILMMLGWGVGVVPVTHLFSFGSPHLITLPMSLWFAGAAIVSLAAGGYFATRFSHLFTAKMGAAYGITISSLFLFVILAEFTFTLQETTPETETQVGWALFSTLVMGTLGSIVGGSIGARMNDRTPVEKREVEEARIALKGIYREPILGMT